MKRVFITLILLIALSFSAYAQLGEKVIMPKLGYQTESERFLMGIEGRYSITNNVRIAPGLSILFPKNHVTGLDVDVNVHYVFPIQGGLALYPFVGGVMMNNRYSHNDLTLKDTTFGLNIGGGAQYDITSNGYLNFEFKYSFIEGTDPAYFTLGYGIKF
ncbi:porin family protein [Dysgonomonas sp. Marseille-P4677]|uniref:outer membrane beta-barrel protein n=1 Tax=Dysgonomonas sp. Marseille-P4677 TaxID=2364790 RepID=UPI0019135BB1|nr:outer membrane beta-barrel protein [Dysgonomonas sp. Marseille-P4677]MBK5721033.1 porin family protein [Dysgonomonas sp. Marseille-P4677]